VSRATGGLGEPGFCNHIILIFAKDDPMAFILRVLSASAVKSSIPFRYLARWVNNWVLIPTSEGQAMKDTSDAMESKYRSVPLERSGEERLKMGCSMHAMAQALVRASALQADPFASSSSLKRGLFLRFYDQDCDAATRKKILRALERRNRGRSCHI
jgi:hypothetical protein